MTSTHTQLPYEYYSLQFCLPKNGTFHYKSENLGEVLRGKESCGSLAKGLEKTFFLQATGL